MPHSSIIFLQDMYILGQLVKFVLQGVRRFPKLIYFSSEFMCDFTHLSSYVVGQVLEQRLQLKVQHGYCYHIYNIGCLGLLGSVGHGRRFFERQTRFGGVRRADRRTRGQGLRPMQVALNGVVRPRWWRWHKSAIDCFLGANLPHTMPWTSWQTVLSANGVVAPGSGEAVGAVQELRVWRQGPELCSHISSILLAMHVLPVSGSRVFVGEIQAQGIRKSLIILLPGGARWPLHVAMWTGPRPPPVLLEKAPL